MMTFAKALSLNSGCNLPKAGSARSRAFIRTHARQPGVKPSEASISVPRNHASNAAATRTAAGSSKVDEQRDRMANIGDDSGGVAHGLHEE